MTAEEALRQAEAEGRTPLEAENVAGYKDRPYQAKVQLGGRQVSLAYCTSPDSRGGGAVHLEDARGAGAGFHWRRTTGGDR